MGTEVYLNDKIEVKNASYGGRACFASSNMVKSTHLLDLSEWMGSSISYEFRKEVCHHCLKYDCGKQMKVKIDWAELEDANAELREHELMTKYKGSGLWFCSDWCKKSFISQSNIIELILLYERLLTCFQSNSNTGEEVESSTEYQPYTASGLEQEIKSTWDNVEHVWIPKIAKMKHARVINDLPKIDEDHYSCVRFVMECLFNLKNMDQTSRRCNTWKSLQSNELEKIMRFPVLLEFQVKVFKWVYILAQQYRYFLTTSVFRHILGSEYGNSFGIWETSESSESREFLGYMVHPEASYFNHSCIPNVLKKRVGRTLQFILQSDVKRGEELCIDYKGILHLNANQRRAILKDNWFFECRCERCLSEMQAIH